MCIRDRTKGVVVTPICPHSLASPAMVFAQERKLNVCVGQVADDEDVYKRQSAHSATVCAMAIVTGRSAGVASPIFAVACVVAIICLLYTSQHRSSARYWPPTHTG